MTIKSDKGIYGFFVVLQVLLLWLSTMVLQLDTFPEREAGIVSIIVLEALAFWCWIVYGRVLIMDKESYTICFLFIQKTYRWDELQTRHLVRFGRLNCSRQPYTEGAVFSKNVIRNPQKRMRKGMVWFVHPFRDFVVYFEPDIPEYLRKSDLHAKIYEVNKSEFLAKLNEWGCEVIRDS